MCHAHVRYVVLRVVQCRDDHILVVKSEDTRAGHIPVLVHFIHWIWTEFQFSFINCTFRGHPGIEWLPWRRIVGWRKRQVVIMLFKNSVLFIMDGLYSHLRLSVCLSLCYSLFKLLRTENLTDKNTTHPTSPFVLKSTHRNTIRWRISIFFGETTSGEGWRDALYTRKLSISEN